MFSIEFQFKKIHSSNLFIFFFSFSFGDFNFQPNRKKSILQFIGISEGKKKIKVSKTNGFIQINLLEKFKKISTYVNKRKNFFFENKNSVSIVLSYGAIGCN